MKKLNQSLEGKILDAIGQAKRNYQKIVSINIPKNEQFILVNNFFESTGKKPQTGIKLETIFGIPIKSAKKLSITIEI